MFGVLRTVLALMVVGQHLFYSQTHIGVFAVFGFFVISGYLMTLIMHQTYGFTTQGRKAFVANRFLRLYPQYWVALIIAIFVIGFIEEPFISNARPHMQYPTTIWEAIQNLMMYFPSWRPDLSAAKPIPVIWALTTELTFYGVICFGASKTFKRVLIWLGLSLAYLAWSFATDQPWQDRYFSLGAGSLPFAIGAGVYFLSKQCKWKLQADRIFWLMMINSAGWALARTIHGAHFAEIGFYINLAICALLVLSLSTGNQISKRLRPFDKQIGDFSYPIYLIHWQIGVFICWLLFDEMITTWSVKALINTSISVPIMLIISWTMIRFLDKPSQRAREKIKKRLGKHSLQP